MDNPVKRISPARETQNAIWAVAAAFGTYFCMYGFRKPFTAASFSGTEFWGLDFKTIVVSTQVIGYMLSKFIGIRVISEMPHHRRALAILLLIGSAEIALLLFGVLPRPWNIIGMFFNGLSLGMVFGLVLGFLEGRRLTEILAAGLCTSFILADGVTKSVGSWLLNNGVSDDWMPCLAGLVFLTPLAISVAMLQNISPPTEADIAARSARPPLNRSERWSLFSRYAAGLILLVAMYLLITIMRSLRADFAPELWRALGEPAAPTTFTYSELYVALGVLLVNGAAVYFRDNRVGFYFSLATCLLGFLIILIALIALQSHIVSAFPFMVLIGLGLYLPYVAMHTTVFERLLAMTRERGNLGFLMYLADAIGYLGYVAVMLLQNRLSQTKNVLEFFVWMCWLSTLLCLFGLLFSWRYFAARATDIAASPITEGSA